MGFRISGLPAAAFAPLFTLSADELAARAIRTEIADAPDSFPCRVSLEDAAPGEALLLLNWQHQPANSPYRASGPIFVRRGADRTFVADNAVPAQLVRRLLSVRAYDAQDLIVEAEVVEGSALEPLIDQFLDRPDVAYIHAHFARRGCYACRIDRI